MHPAVAENLTMGIMEKDKGKCRFSSHERGGSKLKKARKHTKGRRVLMM
jgi:hypothetical protein